MKVLHLFSNYKFTGPADPALVLASALKEIGVDVTFAAGRTPAGDRGVMELARERGLPLFEGLRLSKHGHPLAWIRDVVTLKRLLGRQHFDVVHTHLPNDHHIATTATQATGTPVVRSLYDFAVPRGRRSRISLDRTAALLAPTTGAADELSRVLPALRDRVSVVAPVLDLDRFHAIQNPETRAGWGISPTDLVIGVVARMQLHRRFPELIEGFAQAAREDLSLHLVILGRGTNQQIVAHDPAARSGVGERIHFPGYIDPATYPTVLPAFDALIFLVPGSDGTCRAMREAQLSGVPVITTRRGLLPHLMAHDESGILLEKDTPAAIADAIRSLRSDEPRRRKLAGGAREFALRHFDAKCAAASTLEVYRSLTRGSSP